MNYFPSCYLIHDLDGREASIISVDPTYSLVYDIIISTFWLLF